LKNVDFKRLLNVRSHTVARMPASAGTQATTDTPEKPGKAAVTAVYVSNSMNIVNSRDTSIN
jgi:hypothetical protein